VKRWVIMSAVLPAVNMRNRPGQSCSAQESIERVGSSKITSEAWLIKAWAWAIRCHSLPLSSALPNHLLSSASKPLGRR